MCSRVMCHLVALFYVCMWPKIDLFSALLFEKIPLCVLYYLIVEFECFQSGCLCPASCTDRAIPVCSI